MENRKLSTDGHQAHQYSASYAGNNTVTVDASPLNGDKGYDFGS